MIGPLDVVRGLVVLVASLFQLVFYLLNPLLQELHYGGVVAALKLSTAFGAPEGRFHRLFERDSYIAAFLADEETVVCLIVELVFEFLENTSLSAPDEGV